MADYYTKFYLLVSLPDEAAQSYAIDLSKRAAAAELPGEIPLELVIPIKKFGKLLDDGNLSGLSLVEIEPFTQGSKHEVVFASSEGGQYETCILVHGLLKRLDLADEVCFQWSNDCSRPMEDAYGGGAALVTAENIRIMHTSEWLQKLRKRKQRCRIVSS